MKVICLLLFFFVCGSLAHHCKNTTGYNTRFSLSAYNTYFPGKNGMEAMSFFECGSINIDFKQKQMAVSFHIIISGHPTIDGSLFAFGQNNTMYVTMNNGTACKKFPNSYPFPSGWPNVTNWGKTKIGQTSVDILDIPASPNGPMTNQTVFYDHKHCACLSTIIRNADISNAGVSTMLFFNFENKPNPDGFNLPSSCLNSDEHVDILLNRKRGDPTAEEQFQQSKALHYILQAFQ
ncbi:hypothetical protein CYY_009229 [Polysphondylium violaceum]|uniref:Uncharacterized protein n=1 Tax=Polysphondylium violaceum TaxID=133409 RepID=A0A8J4PN61_9MYCE|nr:hypothetical protein CYY_009229 [Polysphondylium violaceum]